MLFYISKNVKNWLIYKKCISEFLVIVLRSRGMGLIIDAKNSQTYIYITWNIHFLLTFGLENAYFVTFEKCEKLAFLKNWMNWEGQFWQRIQLYQFYSSLIMQATSFTTLWPRKCVFLNFRKKCKISFFEKLVSYLWQPFWLYQLHSCLTNKNKNYIVSFTIWPNKCLLDMIFWCQKF